MERNPRGFEDGLRLLPGAAGRDRQGKITALKSAVNQLQNAGKRRKRLLFQDLQEVVLPGGNKLAHLFWRQEAVM